MSTAAADTSLRAAFAGASATFSGIGLSRFAYAPLFPAMVAAGWVSGAEAGLLGALNLAGYLGGVLGSSAVARRAGTPAALGAGMALAALSFACCAWNGGVAWLGLWRFGSGAAGGLLMALAGPAVQGAVPPARRGLAGGIVISGVGAGIVTASLGVPLLLAWGVAAVWVALAALVALLWVFAGRAWPATPVRPAGGRPPRAAGLYLAYGLSAAGLVPHMVYFADLVVRGRGYAPAIGSVAWLLFGIGGLVGPLLGGRVADRWGADLAFRACLLLQVAALSIVFPRWEAAILLAAFVGGVAATGSSAVTLARAREIGGAGSGAVWVRATATWAVAQASTGFAYAALFARTGSHEALFAVGLALSLAALGPAFWRGSRGEPRP